MEGHKSGLARETKVHNNYLKGRLYFFKMGAIQIDDFDREEHKVRFKAVIAVTLIVFGLLVFRLADLQLAHGTHYEKMSRAQKLRKIVLPPIRGDILDRNGHPMAVTRESFRLLLYADPALRQVSDLEGTIAELLGITEEEVSARFPLRRSTAPFQPAPLLENLSRDDVAALEENLTGLGGLEIEQTTRRVYPQGNIAAQLVGIHGRSDPQKA